MRKTCVECGSRVGPSYVDLTLPDRYQSIGPFCNARCRDTYADRYEARRTRKTKPS